MAAETSAAEGESAAAEAENAATETKRDGEQERGVLGGRDERGTEDGVRRSAHAGGKHTCQPRPSVASGRATLALA